MGNVRLYRITVVVSTQDSATRGAIIEMSGTPSSQGQHGKTKGDSVLAVRGDFSRGSLVAHCFPLKAHLRHTFCL